MKPVFMELCGINSFSEPAKIDFTALLDQGLFGIFGDTGSGKSTILDGIAFALYGNVSRARSSADIVNFRSDRGYVVFVFEIFFEGKRRTFRIEREIKRKKDGKTAQGLFVYEKEGNAFLTRADTVTAGNALLLRIVGLKQEDFEKCIALPQGEFARFIKEQPKERLEIVSRLFDLERFGSALSARANAKWREFQTQAARLSARLEQFNDISNETLTALRKETSDEEAEERTARERFAALRAEEKTLAERVRMRREAEAAQKERDRLLLGREEMRILEEELSRLGQAREIASAAQECKTAGERFAAAMQAKERALFVLSDAEKKIGELSSFDERKALAELEEHIALLSKAETAAEAEREHDAAEAELKRTLSRMEELSTPAPDFEGRERELAALTQSAGDLYSFVESHKDALMRGEYEVFYREIKDLEEKHPALAEDIGPLTAKYAALSEGEKLAFSDLREAFREWEELRNEAQRRLADLELARQRYELNQKRLSDLRENAARLRERMARCEEKMQQAPGFGASSDSLRAQTKRMREDFNKNLAQKKRAEEDVTHARVAAAAAEAECKACGDSLARSQKRLSSLLGEGFASAEEAESLIAKFGDAKEARERLKRYSDALAAVQARYEELSAADLSDATDERLAALGEETERAEKDCIARANSLALKRRELERQIVMLEKKKTYEEEYGEVHGKELVYERLSSLLRGGKFMEFVAEEYLQTVAVNASGRLLSLTSGRYFLRYRSGTGFLVGDNFNAGQLRAVSTLSGGETFLVSLSLALSLSAEICARSARPIEFFFLDEGFGTLDEGLVETVMDSLEKLKKSSFCIGVISHVEELKRRIERKLVVKKATETHGSQIDTQ